MSRVLLLEDYPPLAKVMTLALQREGLEVMRVNSAARGFRAEGFYDLAVLDLELPDGRGTEVARHLVLGQQVGKVIFFTASRDGALLEEARRLGPVVDKDSGLENLLRAAIEALESRHQPEQTVQRAVAVGCEGAPASRGSGLRPAAKP